MNRRIRQYLRDFALAFLVVLAVLILQALTAAEKRGAELADAYKRGVSIGIMAGRADRLTPAAQAQLIEICNKSWPATAQGDQARRRACGVLPPVRRSDQ